MKILIGIAIYLALGLTVSDFYDEEDTFFTAFFWPVLVLEEFVSCIKWGIKRFKN
jgi:hypothetical protein